MRTNEAGSVHVMGQVGKRGNSPVLQIASHSSRLVTSVRKRLGGWGVKGQIDNSRRLLKIEPTRDD